MKIAMLQIPGALAKAKLKGKMLLQVHDELVFEVAAERVEEWIRQHPEATVAPGFMVDAVVVEPWGCHPSYAQGYYDRDNKFYLEWDKISENRETADAWLNEWVYGVKDRNDYWKKLGEKTHKRLKVKPLYSQKINYGKY